MLFRLRSRNSSRSRSRSRSRNSSRSRSRLRLRRVAGDLGCAHCEGSVGRYIHPGLAHRKGRCDPGAARALHPGPVVGAELVTARATQLALHLAVANDPWPAAAACEPGQMIANRKGFGWANEPIHAMGSRCKVLHVVSATSLERSRLCTETEHPRQEHSGLYGNGCELQKTDLCHENAACPTPLLCGSTLSEVKITCLHPRQR